MPRIPEAADVTKADRLQCRTLIEAAGFHAVDYEDDGATWERVLADGECLVLAVWESALFGKPDRREWTLARYNKDGTLGDFAGPMMLADALARAATSWCCRLFARGRSLGAWAGARGAWSNDEPERNARTQRVRDDQAVACSKAAERALRADRRGGGLEKQLAGPHMTTTRADEGAERRPRRRHCAPGSVRNTPGQVVDRAPRRSRPALLVAHFRSGHA